MTASMRAHVELPVTGMTCATCAVRIERQLNRLDGVSASVNYGIGRATVDFDADSVSADDLITTIAATGYEASLPPQRGDAARDLADERVEPDEITVLGRHLAGSAILTVPVLVLAMVPASQFAGWQWVGVVLATPVVLWGGFDFHRAAWLSLRHRTATMDTLISVGSLAAWAWSMVALVFLGTGHIGMRMNFSLLPRNAGTGNVYFDVAATIVTLILA